MDVFDVYAIISIWEDKKAYIVFKLAFFKAITKQLMTAYTKIRIIHIVTDVHIRERGPRGKHLSELLISVYFCL